MRIGFRKARRLIANAEKLFAFIDDVGFLKTLFAHKINLLLQAFKTRSQLFHFRLKILVVQSHKGKLVIAEAQTVDKRIHARYHFVLRLPRNLHFDKALRFAAHKARIVHHARRALNTRDQHHHPNDQRRQNHGQHADDRLHGIRYFLVFPHILHRFESFGVIHRRTLSQNLTVHYSTFTFCLQHKKGRPLCIKLPKVGLLFTLRAAPLNLLHKRLNAFVPYTHAHRFLSASRSVYRRKAHSA